MLLHVAGSCCAKFENGKSFNHEQMDTTTPNIVGPMHIALVFSSLIEFFKHYNFPEIFLGFTDLLVLQ